MNEQNQVLLKFKAILDEHGYDISPDEYDQLKVKDKPHRRTIRNHIGKWQIAKNKAQGVDETQNEQYTEDYRDSSGVLESKSTRIKSLDDALKHFKVDTKLWEVDRYTINKWEVGAKNSEKEIKVTPLYQVKVWLKRIEGNKAEAIRSLIDELTAKSPTYPTLKIKTFTGKRYMYEIAIADLHFAMYAWKEETGLDYDTEIAEDIYLNAINELLTQAQYFPIEQITLPTGNDFFHSDNQFNATTKGTAVDIDSRWQRAFTRGHKLLIKAIDLLAVKAPVVVPIIPGNHDSERVYYLGEVLKAYYSNNPRVEIQNSPNPRKYIRYGNSLIGYTHGCNEKPDGLPLIMATEMKQDWADTECHEWHIGHTHKMKETKHIAGDTYNGVSVRVLPSLASADAWHHSKGYVKNRRAAEAYLWEYDEGYSAHFSTNVRGDWNNGE